MTFGVSSVAGPTRKTVDPVSGVKKLDPDQGGNEIWILELRFFGKFFLAIFMEPFISLISFIFAHLCKIFIYYLPDVQSTLIFIEDLGTLLKNISLLFFGLWVKKTLSLITAVVLGLDLHFFPNQT